MRKTNLISSPGEREFQWSELYRQLLLFIRLFQFVSILDCYNGGSCYRLPPRALEWITYALKKKRNYCNIFLNMHVKILILGLLGSDVLRLSCYTLWPDGLHRCSGAQIVPSLPFLTSVSIKLTLRSHLISIYFSWLLPLYPHPDVNSCCSSDQWSLEINAPCLKIIILSLSCQLFVHWFEILNQ